MGTREIEFFSKFVSTGIPKYRDVSIIDRDKWRDHIPYIQGYGGG